MGGERDSIQSAESNAHFTRTVAVAVHMWRFVLFANIFTHIAAHHIFLIAPDIGAQQRLPCMRGEDGKRFRIGLPALSPLAEEQHRPGHMLLDGAAADAEMRRDILVSAPFQAMHQEDFSRPRRQLLEAFPHAQEARMGRDGFVLKRGFVGGLPLFEQVARLPQSFAAARVGGDGDGRLHQERIGVFDGVVFAIVRQAQKGRMQQILFVVAAGPEADQPFQEV